MAGDGSGDVEIAHGNEENWPDGMASFSLVKWIDHRWGYRLTGEEHMPFRTAG